MAVMQSTRTHDEATQMENLLCHKLSQIWMHRVRYQSYIAHPNYQPPWVLVHVLFFSIFWANYFTFTMNNESQKAKKMKTGRFFLWMLTHSAITLEMILGDKLWTTVQSCNFVITIFIQISRIFQDHPISEFIKINLGQEGLDITGNFIV